ncbi:hypothetical protein FQR65_LT04042 [Abscondita terminalis]|nr:hypothetical protein FQR65_LT04042 [Abscondita terminalis]
MNGYFTFQAKVIDQANQEAVTSVKIYLVSESTEVPAEFSNNLDFVVDKQETVRSCFEINIGYRCNIERISPSPDESGQPMPDQTDVVMHFVNTDTNEAIEATKIQQLLADYSRFLKLRKELSEEGLFLLNFDNPSPDENDEELLRAWLIGVSVVLGTLCMALIVAFIMKTKSLLNRLNKLSVPEKFGSTESGLNRVGLAAPNTNKHAEGANPIYSEEKKIPQFDTYRPLPSTQSINWRHDSTMTYRKVSYLFSANFNESNEGVSPTYHIAVIGPSYVPYPLVSLAANQVEEKQKPAIKLETVDRLMHIPVVESGWNYAGQVYVKLKQSNNLINWTCNHAETSIYLAVNTAMPAIHLFQGPISTIDKVLYNGLEKVEQTVPVINLPPEEIYLNTKNYVNDIVTKNVSDIINKAQIVKNIALESKYTNFAADTLEGALNIAEKYVDIYLPADGNETESEESNEVNSAQTTAEKALHTIHHVDKFSRKLQRRLTRRTLAEAKALKAHSFEAMQALVHVIELIATDPKSALQKGQEMWENLSKDEPENQTRPQNLEEVIVLLTRESARRVVHFVNFTRGVVKQFPDQMQNFTNKFVNLLQDIIKNGHLEDLNHTIYETARQQAHKLTVILHQFNLHTTELLEQIAKMLEQRKKQIESKQSNENSNEVNKANGIEN